MRASASVSPQSNHINQGADADAGAAAHARNHSDDDDIDEPALSDPKVLALAAITDYAVDPDSRFPKFFDGEVIVELKDGRIIREREAMNRGSVDRPLTAQDIVSKYRDNAARQVSAARSLEIEQLVLGLEKGSARDIAQCLGRIE